MKENIFTKILREWNELSQKERLDLIQQFEIINSKFQKRETREIVINSNLPLNENAHYDFREPSILTIKNLQCKPMQIMGSVHHEGFHALVDDYFKNKSDIISLAEIDKDQLHYERALKDIIYNRAFHEGLITLFSLKYYEEKLVRKESCLYLLYNLLQSCQNVNDTFSIFQEYQYPFLVFGDYLIYTAKIESTFSYKKLLQIVESLDKLVFKDKIIPINTQKSIVAHEDSAKLLKFFNENFELFIQIQKEVNPIIKRKYIGKFIQNSVSFEI